MSMDQIINLLAAVTLIEMMVTIGLGSSISQVIDVSRDWHLLIRAVLANYVMVPAAAVGLLLLFQSPPLVATGFLIAAVCPGAPFGPPFTAMARGNVAVAVGLMVILAGSSAVAAPLLLRFLTPWVCGGNAAEINTVKVIGILLGAQLLPLCVGLVMRERRPLLAELLTKPLRRLSTLLNLVTFGLIISVQFRMLAEVRLLAWAGMLALVLAGVIAGWVMGGPGHSKRTAMAMATSVRNVGVAIVIATGSFAGTAAVTAATAFAVFQTIAMALIALIWSRLITAVIPVPTRNIA
jgi:bile acid:Na+ symporter, BASS family